MCANTRISGTVSGTVPMVFSLIFTTTLWKVNFPAFIKVETETKTGRDTCPRPRGELTTVNTAQRPLSPAPFLCCLAAGAGPLSGSELRKSSSEILHTWYCLQRPGGMNLTTDLSALTNSQRLPQSQLEKNGYLMS